jgi:glycine oxidase
VVSSTRGDAFVVGGGVIGTSSAFRLARNGWRVTLFDPTPGAGATWAAAGMIAPNGEIAPGERENYVRQREALASWRLFSSELFDATGETLAIVQTGTLLVGFDAGDRRLVEQFDLVADEFGVTGERVSRESHASYFQDITSRVREGLFYADDAWVDPDRVMDILTRANEQLGVNVVREIVISASTSEGHVELATPTGNFRGDVGILATGSRALPDGVAQRVAHVIRPVRGMTVRVRGVDRSNQPVLRAYVRGRSCYLVSRPGGYCVVGASSDEQGGLGVEVGELQRLLRDALDIVPALETAEIIETRQGLRPASKDLEPFLEVVDDRWAWLSGHYRHGVTLAPLSSLEALEFAEKFA